MRAVPRPAEHMGHLAAARLATTLGRLAPSVLHTHSPQRQNKALEKQKQQQKYHNPHDRGPYTPYAHYTALDWTAIATTTTTIAPLSATLSPVSLLLQLVHVPSPTTIWLPQAVNTKVIMIITTGRWLTTAVTAASASAPVNTVSIDVVVTGGGTHQRRGDGQDGRKSTQLFYPPTLIFL